MKKMVFTITISAILATQNLALAFPFGSSWGFGNSSGINRLGNTWNYRDFTTFGGLDISKLQHATKMEEELRKAFLEYEKKQEIQKAIKELPQFKNLEITKDILEKIYKSITGKRNLGIVVEDSTSFFLKNPQYIYDPDKSSGMSSSVRSVLQKEQISNSISEARKAIERRQQYATVVDKAVSLQTFQEAENRFKQIIKVLASVEKTKDLKDIAELQAHLKKKLAMIQNESAKLQMVAHLRNTEQGLINQQKQQRNMKILNSKNTAMPPIRSIR
ncbi:TrwJ1 protein [Bartonella henselae]|uniref:TrwJ1 protein n=1 Tax=Bartonella henselae TaxID=38323 RepID=X5MGV6_BARHN|nr:type IV secretion system protein [Bartonella henselae]CDO47599.1 TrwJ1 protein [Bartonella henselae]